MYAGKFDNPVYDEPKRWIQRKHERGESWDSIRNACKAFDEELKAFLTSRIIEDDWPPFSPETWRNLVSEQEEIAGKQQNFRFSGNDGALFSPDQDNALKIPENEHLSCVTGDTVSRSVC